MKIIYMGPSVISLGLKRYTVYDGGLPEYVSAMIDAHKELAGLFVPVEDYAAGNFIRPNSNEYKALCEILAGMEAEK